MNPEILFVTGKGGVGKSTMAAALALKKAQQGFKVLLVEIGDTSFYKDYFDLPGVGFQPTPLKPNVSIALWTGQNCLREYIIHLIKVESLYKLFFENAVMKAFVNVAPALPELAIMGKATSGPRKHGPQLPFDCIVVDAYATGHFMALMNAPKGMAEAVRIGPMGEQSRSIDKCLRDSKVCKYYIVSLPEELPVKETEDLYHQLQESFGIKAQIILNKTLREGIPPAEMKAAEKSSSQEFKDFAEDYQKHWQLHQEAQARLNKLNGPIQVVPSLHENNCLRLVEKLAENLS